MTDVQSVLCSLITVIKFTPYRLRLKGVVGATVLMQSIKEI